MKYITCQNCYSSYESESVRCPDCNASQGKKDDGLIFLQMMLEVKYLSLVVLFMTLFHFPLKDT